MNLARGNDMTNLVLAIDGMFSVTDFNKGKANQIFDSVKANNIGIVVKNNKPECILLSPDEYRRIMKRLEDSEDYVLATRRKESSNLSDSLSAEDVFGVLSEDDLKDVEEIDFE